MLLCTLALALDAHAHGPVDLPASHASPDGAVAVVERRAVAPTRVVHGAPLLVVHQLFVDAAHDVLGWRATLRDHEPETLSLARISTGETLAVLSEADLVPPDAPGAALEAVAVLDEVGLFLLAWSAPDRGIAASWIDVEGRTRWSRAFPGALRELKESERAIRTRGFVAGAAGARFSLYLPAALHRLAFDVRRDADGAVRVTEHPPERWEPEGGEARAR